MDYLKDKQYYIDRYDLRTIKDCLEFIDLCTKAYASSLEKIAAEKLSRGETAKAFNWGARQFLFKIEAERYRNKEETIRKWMEEDQVKQDRLDHTLEPQRIFCPDCKTVMKVTMKHLEDSDKELRVLFFFGCPSCKKRRGIYDNGQEFTSNPRLCPKCKAEVKMSVKKESKDKIVWIYSCTSCDFKETEEDDFEKKRAQWKKEEEQDKKLLKIYREKHCSEETGSKALEYIDSLPVARQVYEDELKKYDSFAYQYSVHIKKLSIIELEKLLSGLFTKHQFINLSLTQPEIGQHVIVSFNTQDADSSRKQEVSISDLQKFLKDELEGTNWRLMSDGISYRLGFLSGRLKGYEREEDFRELSGQKEEAPSKIDPEVMSKYAGYHTIQLARLSGKFQGVENIRKRRLEKEPEGFFLEASEGPLTCGICGENRPGDEIWWTPEMLRCADCWRNIKEGVIPLLKDHTYERNSNYFLNWQLSSESDFNIHSSTVRKLRRQGLLHGRDLKRLDGTIYHTIYLIEDNKEFLKKYPRKERPYYITDLLGEKIEY